MTPKRRRERHGDGAGRRRPATDDVLDALQGAQRVQTRADVNRWLLWEASAWFPSCYVYLVENCAKQLTGDAPDGAALAAEADRFAKLAGILNQRLGQSAWLCGDNPTIADIAVAAPMHLHGWAKLPLDANHNLVRWMTQSVEQLPAWQATHVPDGLGLR